MIKFIKSFNFLFKGMPNEWARLLKQSEISKEQQLKNPQAVLDILGFYTATSNKEGNKYMYSTGKESVSST